MIEFDPATTDIPATFFPFSAGFKSKKQINSYKLVGAVNGSTIEMFTVLTPTIAMGCFFERGRDSS